MWHKLNLDPRPFARMVKSPCGGKYPAKERPLVTPTPFDKERAEEIVTAAKAAAKHGPYSDQMDDQMTDGELAYIAAVWDCCPGTASWMNAFGHVRSGSVDAYFKAMDELPPDEETKYVFVKTKTRLV